MTYTITEVLLFITQYYLEINSSTSTSTSLWPPSITDDTATLVRMPILNLIVKTENNKVLYKINMQVKKNNLINLIK